MQDSYELFERNFYEEFQEQVPLFEQELTELFKQSKRKAMEVFNKSAVGDVREEYLRQLKEKMTNKFQHFQQENEQVSEQACMIFLQQNYEPIAQRLRN